CASWSARTRPSDGSSERSHASPPSDASIATSAAAHTPGPRTMSTPPCGAFGPPAGTPYLRAIWRSRPPRVHSPAVLRRLLDSAWTYFALAVVLLLLAASTVVQVRFPSREHGSLA